jgi:SAM-dependent methyltransferase
MHGSERAYDQFAPYFRAYAEARQAYTDAVDAIIMRDIPASARSVLDVGAADGVRGARIARARGLSRLVLAEPSAMMLRECGERGAAEVWAVRAEELPQTDDRFDVITCLWNVLGHVSPGAARVTALRRMGSLLAADGSIFVDVSNRYNASWYGWLPTLRRALYDALFPSEQNGDVDMIWSVGDEQIPARTHVFTPSELMSLIREAGLRIKRRHFIDYGSGETKHFFFEGQILCELGLGA